MVVSEYMIVNRVLDRHCMGLCECTYYVNASIAVGGFNISRSKRYSIRRVIDA